MTKNNISISYLYFDGLTIRQICTYTERSHLSIVRDLNRNCPEFARLIIRKYNSGISSINIAKEIGVNDSSIIRILKRNDIRIRPSSENKRKFAINHDYFSKIDTEEKAYWLGYLYTDGCVRQTRPDISLCLHKNDRDILEKFAESIYQNDYHMTEYKNSLTVRISSQKMKNDLINHGCLPNKTFLIRLPNLSQNLIRHFIRGAFDGDGCICFGKSMSISLTGNKDFVQDIYSLFEKEINTKGCVSKLKRNNNVCSAYWKSKNDLLNIIEYLYSDSNLFLERKFEKAKRIKEAIL